MNFSQALHALFVDLKLQAVIVVIFCDFVLGAGAALKMKTFRLSYVADFAKNDLLEKAVPWAVVYVASKFAGKQQLVIPGLDLGTAAMAIYVAVMAAWTGSILSSLAQLGLPVAKLLPAALVGPLSAPENTPHPVVTAHHRTTVQHSS